MTPNTPTVARPAVSRTTVLSAGTGALGIASGFAIFFLLLEESEHPLKFLGILLFATVLAIVLEHLREIIERRHDECEPKSRSHGVWAGVRVSLVVVALSELFIMAWHAFLTSYGSDDFAAAVEILTGGAFSTVHSTRGDLALLIGLWMVSGVAMSVTLASGIRQSDHPLARRVRESAGAGVLAGVLVAPLVLLVYLLVVHVCAGLYLLVFDPATWRGNLTTMQGNLALLPGWIATVLGTLLWLVERAVYIFGANNPRAPLIVVTAMFVVSIYGIRKEWGGPAVVVLLLAIGLTITPLLQGLGALLLLVLRTALIWIVPGAVLGAIGPMLERPATSRKWWAAVALAAAVVLVIVTVVRLDSRWWLLLPAAGIIVTAALLWRTGSAEAYWPVLAVSVATIVCGLTMAAQSMATFAGVLGGLYDIKNLPRRIAAIEVKENPRLAIYDLPKPFLASLELEWLKSIQIGTDPLGAAKALERATRDVRDLDALAARVEALPVANDAWAKRMHSLEERFNEIQHEPLHHRVHGVIELQRDFTALDEAARKELDGARPLTDAIGKISGRQNSKIAQALAKLDPASLSPTETLQVKAWQKASALSAKLDPYQSALEELAGAPDRRVPGALTTFKAKFMPVATDIYTTVATWLEIGLAGSFAFWVTLGLLAGWSLARPEPAPHEA